MAPLQTYVAWKEHNVIVDNRLMCVYALSNDDPFKQSERIIKKHELFTSFKECENSFGVFTFNLGNYGEDIKHFRNGNYSYFSEKTKIKILEFYKANKYSTEYIDSFLNPDKYFEKYSVLLNVDEWRLRNEGELCDPFNHLKETLDLKEMNTSESKDKLLLF